MTCWVEVFRWGLSFGHSFRRWRANLLKNHALFQNQDLRPVWPDKSFLLFAERLSSLAPSRQENTCQTYVKTAATAHAQTCQNMSGYDLSNIYEETEIKHVSRPPEARSKVFATATAHAQTCQNMSGYDLSNIYEETEIKHVSRHPEARAHAQTCHNMSGYDLSNIYKEKESKQVSRPPEARSKVCNSKSACSNMPNHVRRPPVKHIWIKGIKHVSRPPESSNHVLFQQIAPPTSGWIQMQSSKMSGSLQWVIHRPVPQALQRGSTFGLQLVSQFSKIRRWPSA